MAIAKGKLGKPAGVEDACPDSAVKSIQAIHMEQAVVRLEETAARQGDKGRQGQQDNPPAGRNTP